MSQMYINPGEMQWGVRNSFVSQGGLSDIDVGTDDYVVEYVLSCYQQDIAFGKKVPWSPYYYKWWDSTSGDTLYTYADVGTAPYGMRVGSTNPAWGWSLLIGNMFHNIVHVFQVIHSLTYEIYVNGHLIHTANKLSHNLNLDSFYFFNNVTLGGISIPSIGCLMRLYAGDLSGISSSQMLAIHRKYLRHPFVRIPELNPYLKFAWEGRQSDTAPGVIGPQILAGCTYLENAINGEHLALQAPNNTWGSAKTQIWQPR